MFMKIVSSVTIAVKKNGKFLLLKVSKGNVWGFPSKEFNENLNGNLDDTVKRLLKTVTDLHQKIDYLGSFLRKEKNQILIGYNFLIENFEDEFEDEFEIKSKPYMWADRNEIECAKLDKNTLTFLKLHSDFV
jgi:hypothetical protein